jgi:hypothetical protein
MACIPAQVALASDQLLNTVYDSYERVTSVLVDSFSSNAIASCSSETETRGTDDNDTLGVASKMWYCYERRRG